MTIRPVHLVSKFHLVISIPSKTGMEEGEDRHVTGVKDLDGGRNSLPQPLPTLPETLYYLFYFPIPLSP